MFVIQFATPRGPVEYIVDLTPDHIEGSRSVGKAKIFPTTEAAQKYIDSVGGYKSVIFGIVKKYV